MIKILFNLLILYFLISEYLTQICGKDIPTSSNDCISDSNQEYTCCYASVGNYNQTSRMVVKNTTMCVLIPVNQTFVTPYITKMDLGIVGFNLNIKIDCGNYTESSSNAFPKCGMPDPQNMKDCSKYDGYNKTCCYIGSPGGSGTCLLNPGKFQTNSTIFGVMIACYTEFLKLPFMTFIILILIFL
jgi:hypothetical protein